MFTKISDLYQYGNFSNIRKAMLHSTAWHQGGFIAFGEGQQNRLWLDWITHCGLSEIEIRHTLKCPNNQYVYIASIKPSKGESVLTAIFLVEHNGSVIKTFDMRLDTSKLSNSIGYTANQLQAWWPSPDPLLLSDYDQQQHPQTTHAIPGDLADLGNINASVSAWWQIWQQQELSNIASLYAETSDIDISSANTLLTKSQLLQHNCELLAHFNRHYCQLEDVYYDATVANIVAIKWLLEGDIAVKGGMKRVRLPMMTTLDIQQGQIVQDTTIFDGVAFFKQFGLVAPIL